MGKYRIFLPKYTRLFIGKKIKTKKKLILNFYSVIKNFNFVYSQQNIASQHKM